MLLYFVIGGAFGAALFLGGFLAFSRSEDRKDQAARDAGLYWP